MATAGLTGVKFPGALTGVPGFDVIRDTFPDDMHLLYNLFCHLISLTTQYQPASGTKKAKGVNIQPLGEFVAREQKAQESIDQYQAAIRIDREKHQRNADAVQACRDLYKLFGLDEAKRYEVCRRFHSIKALPRQVGTGSPYKNFGKLNTASVHFFLRYCNWIYDDIPGLGQAQVATIKRMFSLAKLCMRRTLPCKVEEGLGDYIVSQVC